MMRLYDPAQESREASQILKAALARQGVTYNQLAVFLANSGQRETVASIANKISRGTFSFAFFIRCMKVLRCRHVDLGFDERSNNG